MDFALRMSMVLGVVGIFAIGFYVWLCTKNGKKWLKSLD